MHELYNSIKIIFLSQIIFINVNSFTCANLFGIFTKREFNKPSLKFQRKNTQQADLKVIFFLNTQKNKEKYYVSLSLVLIKLLKSYSFQSFFRYSYSAAGGGAKH